MRHSRSFAVSIFFLGACPGDEDDGDGSTAADSASESASAGESASTSGSGSTSASSSASGSGSASGATSTSATASGSGSEAGSEGGGCEADPNSNPAYICCEGAWVDPRSDLFNCGGCGIACGGDAPFCDQGTCAAPPCDGGVCSDVEVCCGSQCCGADTICCTLNGPIESGPGCVPPQEGGNCPPGCAPLCRCAAPDTMIATPAGEQAIATLEAGDLVYSIDDGAIAVVPVGRTQRVAVEGHRVVRVVLGDGRTIRMTGSHPLADGRAFADVRVGERLGDAVVREVESVGYDEPFTHDILPLSSTGTYFVGGEAIASTMRGL